MTPKFPTMFEDKTEQLRNFWKDLSTRQIAAAALVLMVVALAAWFLFGSGNGKDRQRPPPVVITAAATVKDVTVTEHAVGTVVANATVAVTAQVSGPLVKAAFQEGQIVPKGALLFVIDPRPFQAALDQAIAQRARDEAQRVSAVATQKRYDALFAANAISSQQHDTADAAAKSAIATVAADAAQVAAARLNLGYTEIRSPVTGKTGAILIQPGNLINAGSANPLVVITEIEPVKVSFSLSQNHLADIQARERAGGLYALINAGGPLRAKVGFVSNQISGTSGTIELRASFDNKDHRLVPGEMVDVDVALNTLAKATVVPREAINEGPNGRYVFVVGRDQIALMRAVTVLFDDGTLAAVKGVRRGEKVVTDGQLRVVPGAKVSTGARHKTGKAP